MIDLDISFLTSLMLLLLLLLTIMMMIEQIAIKLRRISDLLELTSQIKQCKPIIFICTIAIAVCYIFIKMDGFKRNQLESLCANDTVRTHILIIFCSTTLGDDVEFMINACCF